MSEESTLEKEPASLNDELKAAFDAVGKEEEVVEVKEESEPEGIEVQEETPEEITLETQDEPLSPPDHWSSEDKETFSSAPRNVQEWALRRHKDMEADYTRKTQEVAGLRDWQSVEKEFEPFRNQMMAEGLTPQSYVQGLLAADKYLRTEPEAAIKWLAERYGADLKKYSEQEEYSDPETQALKQELASLKRSIAQQGQMQFQAAQGQVVQSIQAFGEEMSGDKPAHPYFNEVLPEMVAMAKVERAQGRQPDLKTLYDKAVWANTSVREKMIQSEKQSAIVRAQEEARKRADQAAKAAVSVTGAPSGNDPVAGNLSLREQLETAYRG